MSLARTLIHIPRHKWAIWQMERSGLSKMFNNRAAKAFPPQAFDLWFLYRQVRRRKPATIVEFGTGNSTLVMAEALKRNRNMASLFTIDASRQWLDDTWACLPMALKPYVQPTFSDIETMEIGGERCHRFTKHPEVESIDMLFLDGPSPKDIPGWKGKPLAADPVLLEGKFAPGFCMIVDSRLDNVAFLKRHLKRRYRVSTDKIFGITTFDLTS